MASPSAISITVDDIEVSDRCVYQQTSFTSQANPIQGSFSLVLRDPDQDFSVTAGNRVALHVDGVPLFGGYVMRIGRGNFFPAADTSVPLSVRSRKWTLTGPDYNVLFDKRVLNDPDDPTRALAVPSGSRTISKAFTYLVEHFVDGIGDLDVATFKDVITTSYGTEEDGGLFVGQGKTWREQMEDFADNGGIVYWIDADRNVHLHEYEALLSPWSLTDSNPNGVTTVGFREGEYAKDFMQAVTESLVWGGSAIRPPGGPGGDIVFARYPDPPANTATWHGRTQPAGREQDAIDRMGLYGRWQHGEEHAGQENYLTLGSVKNRAFVIINGVPGAVPTHGIEGGLSRPIESMSATWFAHDVPGAAHVVPGTIMNFILHTQGTGPGNPLVTTLPCRSMRVSFPTLPTDNPGGQTYVRFEGEFGTSHSDSRHLWKALKRNRRTLGQSSVIVDNSSTGVPAGSLATVYPDETPNGTRVAFTFPYTFYEDQLDLFLNGLYQRAGIDYTYSPSTKRVTFVTPPGTGDQMWAIGYVSE